MTRRLDAGELRIARLSTKRVGEFEFEVRVGDRTVGQIMRRRRSFGRVVWFWSLSGSGLPETMDAAGSNAQTFEGAKQAVKRVLDDWLRSVTAEAASVEWEGGSKET